MMSTPGASAEVRRFCTPPPDALLLVGGKPNPHGAGSAEAYLLRGDATVAPITRILPGEGVRLPPCLLPLAPPVRIKLLHINDLHGHVVAFTSSGCEPVFSRMVSRLRAAREASARDERSAVLVATAGDDFGGAIFDELLGQDAATFKLHAGYRLYSAVGVDVGVVGNHDLDPGDAVLAEAVRRDARFPVLAANIVGSSALAQAIVPATLYVFHGVRIGFIGLVTPAQRCPEPGCAWRITDPIEAAHNLIPAFRPLCDVLIILSHLGRSLAERSAHVQVAGDFELARCLPPGSVDLIVGGHTHNALNEHGLSPENVVNGIPIVQAGSAGEYLGEVEITVGERVSVTLARLHPTAGVPVDADFEREHVRPLIERVRPYRSRLLGRVADDEGLSTDAVRNGFATGESPLANFITDALVVQARAHGYPVDLAMVDRSAVSCGLPIGGELTFGHWFEVMPYSDVVGLCRLSGRQLLALLQDNALRIDRPDEPHTQRGFLHFSAAVRYKIERGGARGQARAVEIDMNGEAIEASLDRTFLVGSASFVRGLAAAWEAQAPDALRRRLVDLKMLPWEYATLRVRDLLVEYILARGGVLPEGGAARDNRLVVLT